MCDETRELFLIQAHEDAGQLRALVERLIPASSQDRAIIHIDARSALWRETRGRFLADLPQVEVIARPIPVFWAHHSQVRVGLKLLEAAITTRFDVAHLLSGQDWPVVDKATRLRGFDGRAYIEAEPDIQTERMNAYCLTARYARHRPNFLPWRLERLLEGLGHRLPHRRDPAEGPWHWGSQWWSLPADLCHALVPRVRQLLGSGRLAATLCADEYVIPTLLAHGFADRLAGTNRRAIFWDGDISPRTLTAADWRDVVNSGAWFARKVSRKVDPFFLDL